MVDFSHFAAFSSVASVTVLTPVTLYQLLLVNNSLRPTVLLKAINLAASSGTTKASALEAVVNSGKAEPLPVVNCYSSYLLSLFNFVTLTDYHY